MPNDTITENREQILVLLVENHYPRATIHTPPLNVNTSVLISISVEIRQGKESSNT